MFSHEQIWKAIDKLAADHGYSTSGLAKVAGLDPTSFNKSKRYNSDGKPRWPSTESISKIMVVTGITASEFLEQVSKDSDFSTEYKENGADCIPLINFQDMQRDSVLNKNLLPQIESGKWQSYPLPFQGLYRRNTYYAVKIDSKDFEPCYRLNDTLIVQAICNIKLGNKIIAKTDNGEIHIGILVKNNIDSILLKSLNYPQRNCSIESNNFTLVAKIVWASQ